MPTIYAAGDTAVHADMGLIGEIYTPAIAILPIGDHYTMGPLQAAYAARLIGAPEIVPGPLRHVRAADRHAGRRCATSSRASASARRCTRAAPARSCEPSRDVLDRRLRRRTRGSWASRSRRSSWPSAPSCRGSRPRSARSRRRRSRTRATGPTASRTCARARAPREALDAVLAADAGPRRPPGRASSTRAAAARRTPGRAAWPGPAAAPAPATPCRATSSPGPDVVDAMAEAYEAEQRRARGPAAARAGGRRCRRRRPPRPAVGRDRRRRARRRLRRQRRPPRRPARRRPRGPGGRAAPPVRHPRAAHGHDAGGAEAAARRRARRRGARRCSRAPAIPSEAGEDGLRDALRAFVGTENLEARWWHEERLDPVVLAHLRTCAAG